MPEAADRAPIGRTPDCFTDRSSSENQPGKDRLAPARPRGAGRAGARFGVPNGVRTRVATLKEWSPRPLDDGDAAKLAKIRSDGRL